MYIYVVMWVNFNGFEEGGLIGWDVGFRDKEASWPDFNSKLLDCF